MITITITITHLILSYQGTTMYCLQTLVICIQEREAECIKN